MVGMCDAMEEELLSNFIQLLQHVYRPALESLLFFADEGPEKTRVYEEVLMAIQSLFSSLKGNFKQMCKQFLQKLNIVSIIHSF